MFQEAPCYCARGDSSSSHPSHDTCSVVCIHVRGGLCSPLMSTTQPCRCNSSHVTTFACCIGSKAGMFLYAPQQRTCSLLCAHYTAPASLSVGRARHRILHVYTFSAHARKQLRPRLAWAKTGAAGHCCSQGAALSHCLITAKLTPLLYTMEHTSVGGEAVLRACSHAHTVYDGPRWFGNAREHENRMETQRSASQTQLYCCRCPSFAFLLDS